MGKILRKGFRHPEQILRRMVEALFSYDWKYNRKRLVVRTWGTVLMSVVPIQAVLSAPTQLGLPDTGNGAFFMLYKKDRIGVR